MGKYTFKGKAAVSVAAIAALTLTGCASVGGGGNDNNGGGGDSSASAQSGGVVATLSGGLGVDPLGCLLDSVGDLRRHPGCEEGDESDGPQRTQDDPGDRQRAHRLLAGQGDDADDDGRDRGEGDAAE